MMITIPASFIVKRYDKEVHSFQGFQHRLAVHRLFRICINDRLAQWSADMLQNRRLHEEITHLLGLKPEYLFDQIVHDIVMTAGECCDETVDIFTGLHRKGSQL